MTDLEKIELAIRRAASQMPGGAARTFRLFADELHHIISAPVAEIEALHEYRRLQKDLE